MKRYKLLRELPGYEAGTVFEKRDDGYYPVGQGSVYTYITEILKNKILMEFWFETLDTPKHTKGTE